MSRNAYEPLDVVPANSTDESPTTIERTNSAFHLSESWRIPLAFWCLGLLNNASYVIMLASAKDISEGGTALVFIANVLPSLAIKLCAPYFFHLISYHARILISAALMGSSFVVVATFDSRIYVQLVGVALASAQCGLGEASLLALAGLYDATCTNDSRSHSRQRPSKANCITCFSSGTGLAGVFGFLWKYVWEGWLGFSLRQTLWMACVLVLIYTRVYVKNLWNDEHMSVMMKHRGTITTSGLDHQEAVIDEQDGIMVGNDAIRNEDDVRSSHCAVAANAEIGENDDEVSLPTCAVKSVQDMTSRERFRLVLSLYPYMIPLFLVYAAEYALQAGTWSAIGFPVTSLQARDKFFEYSNWMYQAGVFLSRSSGTFFTAPMYILWLMPILQCINVVFFWIVAANHFWYNYWLLLPCFYVGLLGGAVYVNGYLRICADLPLAHREFSLSATSVAEGVGILVADLAGLYIQSCLYQRNGLDGAVVSCPIT